MSRAFSPPDTLSKDDIRTIADVRRDVWTAGFKGLFYGSTGGWSMHTLVKFVHSRLPESTKLKLPSPGDAPFRFSRNTAFLSFMLGGAIGSFVMATTAGKNRVHKLHSIYEVGKAEKSDGMTDYQRDKVRALEEQEEEIRDRYLRRLSRRATIRKRLEEGQGLSNSRGGNWVQNTPNN